MTVSSGVGAMPNCLPSTGSVGVIAGKCRKPSLQSWLSWPATKELVVSKPWWLGAGSAFRLRVVSTQPFAGAHVLAQPALLFPKLVEPTCELCELVVSKPLVHVWGFGVGFWLFGCGVVSTRVARSSRPGSTSFEETVSFVATPKPGGPAKQGGGGGQSAGRRGMLSTTVQRPGVRVTSKVPPSDSMRRRAPSSPRPEEVAGSFPGEAATSLLTRASTVSPSDSTTMRALPEGAAYLVVFVTSSPSTRVS